MNQCKHLILNEVKVSVTRCALHSRTDEGVAMWVWSALALPIGPCPCEFANRFLVATEQADIFWLERADVLACLPRATRSGALHAAQRLPSLLGYAFGYVPAGRHSAVVRTQMRCVPLDPPVVCEICLYPWLANGHSLDDLAGVPLG